MPKTAKEVFAANLLAVLRQRAGKQIEKRQAVTALVNLGIATGNAQRLVDGTTNVQLNTIALVADKLKTSPAALVAGEGDAARYSDQALAFAAWFDTLNEDDRRRAVLMRDVLFRPGINPTNFPPPGPGHRDEPDSGFSNLNPSQRRNDPD